MKKLVLCLLAVLVSSPLTAQGADTRGREQLVIRGRRQNAYFFPAHPMASPTGAPATRGTVLFLPGDGGWTRFAAMIARELSSRGYDVAGVDTKRYLESFTGKTTLSESEVMSDVAEMAAWAMSPRKSPVFLVGWSEGAGLALLGAASEDGRDSYRGLVVVGLPESNLLAWRWSDFLSYITKKDPREPEFPSAPYLPRVSPLPLVMVQSSRDEYVPVEVARDLFALAGEPKKFVLIEARDHHFGGSRPQFLRALQEGLEWIVAQGRHSR